ncbi:auxin-responsive protein saur50 [Quercus suber]|uniref:Auxin-responsive protein saur50 n=2 Tax=Quercus suber TaxID=58331 RepID=A0AAW0L0Q2_QUESU
MAKLRTSSSNKKKIGIVKLKIVVEKLQKSLLLGRKSNPYRGEYEDVSNTSSVPEDVKEGHFSVIAVNGDEPKRFVVPLSYLTHPTFLRLLEQAAEE